jgi:hypothetical protein
MKLISYLSLLLATTCFAGNVAALPSLPDNLSFALPATDEGVPGAGPIRREDWFQKVWTERRSAFAKRVEQDRNAVVFFGDSITQG